MIGTVTLSELRYCTYFEMDSIPLNTHLVEGKERYTSSEEEMHDLGQRYTARFPGLLDRKHIDGDYVVCNWLIIYQSQHKI